MSNQLKNNQATVEREARDIASSLNKVLCGKVPKELTEKYLGVVLNKCSYSLAVSRKAANNTRDIAESYRLSTEGNITAASVFKSFFILKKVFKSLRIIVRGYDSFESRDRLIAELKSLRRVARSAYM